MEGTGRRKTTGGRDGPPTRQRGTDIATSAPRLLALGLLFAAGDARRDLDGFLRLPAVPIPLGRRCGGLVGLIPAADQRTHRQQGEASARGREDQATNEIPS